ncbi:hypothetical protein BJP41_04435 [Candidatus Williamhamiltonella defendens]|uniref:Transposase n=3 Tax=Candidatus Williamhamiltonella defendens TaxID=138072 RepID=C4K6I0_HAMD5|nr:hypothetical protein [Candidatus Hamiltonella defensa]ACQ68173.1 putative transposase [Candidatus Hamiltonella defensa 5AT (Acyrthosiphon pisum)]ATW22769.1 hypothetical protein BJP44_06885 [Candidatus Hamiltonella defensa]ATW29712.1 hypothetical protein BJP41_04435 [Candidatus Hamiltonella defensa]ATW31693.1 hypothetical protein BJP42_04520 [Candidatus Hamiltonella defensa]
MTMAQQIEEIGIQKSMKKGIEEREKQASLKIVRHLLENGMESQSVRQITGLSETEMKSLFQDSP